MTAPATAQDSGYNFAYLDEQTKRMVRRAILKAVAIPGHQVPFGSREMPLPYGWGTGDPRPPERGAFGLVIACECLYTAFDEMRSFEKYGARFHDGRGAHIERSCALRIGSAASKWSPSRWSGRMCENGSPHAVRRTPSSVKAEKETRSGVAYT